MTAGLALIQIVPAAVAAYLCLYGPGHAWWHGRTSALPRSFARLTGSTAWTTALGVALVALDSFSLPRVVAINGLITLVGYLSVGRARGEAKGRRGIEPFGPVVFAATLFLLSPPLETHFGASDSTSYVSAGVHLNRHHTSWKADDVAPLLAPQLRHAVFQSVFGHAWKPPYSRVPGAMVVEHPTDDIAHPTFFPAPTIWAAYAANTLGARHAGAFAPLFTAIALWATFLFAERRLGLPGALGCTALIGASYAGAWVGRLPMSEPLAWAFLWSGLVAYDAWESEGAVSDAKLAGILLAATGLVRVDYLLIIVSALLVFTAIRGRLGARSLPGAFWLSFAAGTAMTLVELTVIRGAYVAPIKDSIGAVLYRATMLWNQHAALLSASGLAAVAAFAIAARRVGFSKAFLVAAAAGTAVLYATFGANPRIFRSLTWLNAGLGPLTLAAAPAGLVLVLRDERLRRADLLFVLLVVITGTLLIWNPRVSPVLPWALRRFVPLVFPAAIVFAALVAVRAGTRSVVAAAVLWIVVGVSVVLPARWAHSRAFYRGSFDQLNELVSDLPADGVYLIDQRTSALILGAPLWLIHERRNIPVFAGSKQGRQTITAVTRSLQRFHPVFLIKPTALPHEAIRDTKQELLTDYTFQVVFPQQDEHRMPERRERLTRSISVYRLKSAYRYPK